MFLEIPDLLSPQELERLQAIAAAARFVNGRISNPHSEVKNNLHHATDDATFIEAGRMLGAALHRAEPFRLFAFPRRFAPPTMTKHRPGMAYGLHCDAPTIAAGPRPLRSDLSCTIWLNPADAYGGGELSILLGTREVAFKGAAGSCLLYPSTTLHEVRPVTSGERLVAITFVESMIADAGRRELLYELNEVAALEGLQMSWNGRTRLSAVASNLQRMWAEPV